MRQLLRVLGLVGATWFMFGNLFHSTVPAEKQKGENNFTSAKEKPAEVVESDDSSLLNLAYAASGTAASGGRPRRLELVHIPKTGGTALEVAAARANVPWSFCHFKEQFNPGFLPILVHDAVSVVGETKKKTRGEAENDAPAPPPLQCPPSSLPKGKGGACRWHVPPCFVFAGNEESFYTDAALFAVVRNPYDRFISDYRFRTPPRQQSVSSLNAMATEYLEGYQREQQSVTPCRANTLRRKYFFKDCHYVPQVDYIYGGAQPPPSLNGTAKAQPPPPRIVHHVLRYERLATEFAQLMRAYQLNVTLPQKKAHKHSSNVSLSRHSLTPYNQRLIESIYHNDFVAFGYPRLQGSASTTTSEEEMSS